MSNSSRSVSDGNELILRSAPSPFACSDVTMEEFKNIDDDIDSKSLNLGADLSAQEKIVLREKVIIVGESCVGKSSLIKSFVNKGSFNYDAQATKYLMTSRLDMQIVTVEVPNSYDSSEHGNVDVDLFLYDFGGQSIFHQREMANEYQKDATYILCVYDISSRTSLQSISTWLASVRSVVGQKIPAILVANKIDLREEAEEPCQYEVEENEGEEFAEENGFELFLECSVKTGIRTQEVFQHIAKQSAANYRKTQ